MTGRSGRGLLVVAALVATLVVPGATVDRHFDHQHKAWTTLLERHVLSDGGISQVDYAALAENPVELASYLKVLSQVTPSQYAGWTNPQRLAFLINAYNAFTVRLIIDNYPLASIKDLGGWFSSPWKKHVFRLLGEERHLDDIEHGIIRKEFDEPRIHFAVNCAAQGCPPLRSEAYVPDRLDAQLEDNTRTFLRDPRRNRYDAAQSVLELSSVMKWYRKDFAVKHGSLEAFVATRMTNDPTVQSAIRNGDVRVRFLDYDWRLNGQ